MIIRALCNKDLEHGFRETLENLRSVGDLSVQQMEEILEIIRYCDNHFVFVAVDGDQVIGTITLIVEQKFIRQGGKVGHIEDVAVQKGWEGRGVGGSLVKFAIDQARERMCYKVILDCSAKNKSFYERMGFKEHEIEMRMDL